MKVGTKELKNRLSHYVRRVREGASVYVTDRGKVVAELRAVTSRRVGDRALLRELAARDAAILGTGRYADFEPLRLRSRARLSDAVIEGRG
jgi:antitoxin (DNA-binding transcriptional repressor) of toxin-antitoxin stability system